MGRSALEFSEDHSVCYQPTLLPIKIGRFFFMKLISSKNLFEKMLSYDLPKIKQPLKVC